MRRIGQDVRMFGPQTTLMLFNKSGHADLFKGIGENPRHGYRCSRICGNCESKSPPFQVQDFPLCQSWSN
jgi:hypothetical protein